MTSTPDHDVAIIGAGLAGLRAAITLGHAGLDVIVLEASDGVGGRQRTDRVDGFLLDRGFQVLNPAYPAIRRWVDTQALRLQPFPAAVQVRRNTGLVTVADPRRHPRSLPATLRSGLVDPRGLLGLARWAAPGVVAPRAVIARAERGRDAAVRVGWDRAGFRGPLRTEVVESFLSGVIADDAFETSDAFVRLLVRMFALGTPGLPQHGIQALPEQLAAYARSLGAEIRLARRVSGIRTGAGGAELDVDGTDPVRARAVIVAVGPESASDLADVPAVRTRGLQTWWFTADAAPAGSRMLAVDGRRAGPVVNTAVISNVAPTYSSTGRPLIEATCLLPATGGGGADAATEQDVRRHLAEIWGTSTAAWELIRRDDLPHALPAQPAPLRAHLSARVGEAVYIAGDHRDTASIQGALVSGDRVARAVLEDRGR